MLQIRQLFVHVRVHGRSAADGALASSSVLLLVTLDTKHMHKNTHVGVNAAEFQKLAFQERFPLCTNRTVPLHT